MNSNQMLLKILIKIEDIIKHYKDKEQLSEVNGLVSLKNSLVFEIHFDLREVPSLEALEKYKEYILKQINGVDTATEWWTSELDDMSASEEEIEKFMREQQNKTDKLNGILEILELTLKIKRSSL